MKLLLILICLSFSINLNLFAAEDTLLVKWHNKSLSDSTRISSYEKYIWNEHIDKNSDSIEFHLDKLISFSKTKKSDLGLSLSLNIRGVLSIKAGRYDEAIDYFQQSIKIGNKYVRAKSQFNIAITNYYHGDFEQALKGFRKVISIYKELDSKADLASTYGNIGSVYKDLADYKMALESYNIALNIYKELNEKDKISYIYNNLGVIYKEKAEYVRALEYFDKSIEIKNQLGDKFGNAASFHNIGLIYKDFNEYDKALFYINKGIELEKEKKNTRGLALSYKEVGEILLAQNKYNSALSYLEKSLEMHKKIGDKSGKGYSLLSIGNLYYSQKNYGKAIDYFNKSLIFFEELSEQAGISNALSLKGLSDLKLGNIKAALAVCKQSELEAKGVEDILTKKTYCQCLYNAYKESLRPKEALHYYEKYINYSGKLNNIEATKGIQKIEFQKIKLADSLRQDKLRMATKMKYENRIAEENQQRNIALGIGFIFVLVAGGLYNRNKYIRKTKDEITNERDRSENLLLNILPAEIAKELKEKGKSEARDFKNVTILFTDFKEFTQASEKLTAHELLNEINHCFEKFDDICDKYRVEKIKTIGDSYMAAGGLPRPFDLSTKNTVLAGIEMQQFIINRKIERSAEGKAVFEMRVGLYSGPVVAGIVGVKKFQYDIWGDTVNTASRMESAGEVHKVNIGQSTYEQLKNDPDFVFEHRGKINAKGKGEIDMYFVDKVESS